MRQRSRERLRIGADPVPDICAVARKHCARGNAVVDPHDVPSCVVQDERDLIDERCLIGRVGADESNAVYTGSRHREGDVEIAEAGACRRHQTADLCSIDRNHQRLQIRGYAA